VKADPRPGTAFRQELDTATGSIRIQSSNDHSQTSILLWVDANRPVVRVEIDSSSPMSVRIAVELWRTAERTREGAEGHCSVALRSVPVPNMSLSEVWSASTTFSVL
jgi:hypothetical protein